MILWFYSPFNPVSLWFCLTLVNGNTTHYDFRQCSWYPVWLFFITAFKPSEDLETSQFFCALPIIWSQNDFPLAQSPHGFCFLVFLTEALYLVDLVYLDLSLSSKQWLCLWGKYPFGSHLDWKPKPFSQKYKVATVSLLPYTGWGQKELWKQQWKGC